MGDEMRCRTWKCCEECQWLFLGRVRREGPDLKHGARFSLESALANDSTSLREKLDMDDSMTLWPLQSGSLRHDF